MPMDVACHEIVTLTRVPQGDRFTSRQRNEGSPQVSGRARRSASHSRSRRKNQFIYRQTTKGARVPDA